MPQVTSHRQRYLASLAAEIVAPANRVRDLIGRSHWLSDGHHKEFLLTEVIQRHLPSSTIATRGFVLSPFETDQCSREQDILIVDVSKEAPVFNQGNLVICFPSTVLAAISVKSMAGRGEFYDSIRGLNSVRDVTRDAVDGRGIWCGAYFFEAGDPFYTDASIGFTYITDGLSAHRVTAPSLPPSHPYPVGPDFYCLAGDLIYRMDYRNDLQGAFRSTPPGIRGYRCNGLASALFIADLLDHIAVRLGLKASDFANFADVPDLEQIELGDTK